MRPVKDWRGSTSTSRVFAQRGYQISDELVLKQRQVLERRYGERAHHAACLIQRAFRQYCLRKRWTQMTTSPTTKEVKEKHRPDLTLNRRYVTTTSLSAQLRADRASQERDRVVHRSPPSPSPTPRSHHTPSSSGAIPSNMIESLMSPRLGHRRFAPRCGGTVSQTMVADGAEVWLPRPSLIQHNPAHSNSLPRLDKHKVHNSERHQKHQTPPRSMSEQERKRQYRIALNFFNKKPERGVQLLTSWAFVDQAPESLARLLFGRRGLSKLMVGEYIGTLHSSFHSLVLKYFMQLIDVRGLEIDVALRKAMQYFILPKEAEKIDTIIQAFALHYAKSNPRRTSQFRGGWDTIHLLSFAVIMLNTDLHSPNVKQRMTNDDFVKNLRGQDKVSGEKDGKDIERYILEGIYERIKADELKPGDDHVAQVARVDRAIIGKEKPVLTETPRRLVCYCRLQQVIDPMKKQSWNSRERDVFLFNDMIVVAKGVSKRKSSSVLSGATYTLKQWSLLMGAEVHEFQKGPYEFGLTIVCPNNERIYFNARNFDDRHRFVADISESIREATEMEQVRIEIELDRHLLRTDSQRDSGLPDMDDHLRQAPAGQINGTFRRLSFNSLDSGVVEEHLEAST